MKALKADALNGGTRGFARAVWRTDPLLCGASLLLLLVFAGTVAGLVLDPRVIMGAPAWLKPAKFAISTSIYTLTLAWVFTHLKEWPRTRRVVGGLTVTVMLIEVAIVSLQAARGATSHFNVATPFDAVLFAVMGLAIVTQTLATIAVAVALWRQRFDDRAMGVALRVGMTLSILGASVGGAMTARPTDAQLAEARLTGRLTTAGAHTVGGPDGGPGLPGVGWSTTHGDLRVPHFFGLHALQALPIFVFLLGRRPERWRMRFTWAAAAVYAVVFLFLLAQAATGIPLMVGGAR